VFFLTLQRQKAADKSEENTRQSMSVVTKYEIVEN
jgi:hypothetical protein